MSAKAKKEISKIIKSARVTIGITQKDLGEKLNAEFETRKWTQDYVSKAESGQIQFTEEEVLFVAKILNIEPESINQAIEKDLHQKISEKTGVISMDLVEITSEDLMAVLDYVNSIGGKARYGLIRQMIAEKLRNKGIEVFFRNGE